MVLGMISCRKATTPTPALCAITFGPCALCTDTDRFRGLVPHERRGVVDARLHDPFRVEQHHRHGQELFCTDATRVMKCVRDLLGAVIQALRADIESRPAFLVARHIQPEGPNRRHRCLADRAHRPLRKALKLQRHRSPRTRMTRSSRYSMPRTHAMPAINFTVTVTSTRSVAVSR